MKVLITCRRRWTVSHFQSFNVRETDSRFGPLKPKMAKMRAIVFGERVKKVKALAMYNNSND